jgi:hypothetical protein
MFDSYGYLNVFIGNKEGGFSRSDAKPILPYADEEIFNKVALNTLIIIISDFMTHSGRDAPYGCWLDRDKVTSFQQCLDKLRCSSASRAAHS